MYWKQVHLELSDGQIAALEAHNAKLFKHLEENEPLRVRILDDLKAELSKIVNSTPGFVDVLQQISHSGDHVALQVLNKNNEILNLPWSMAVDDRSGQALGQLRQLNLIKSLPEYLHPVARPTETAAPPLKILVMISSPENADHTTRLSHEAEEFQILSAFEPLLQSGQVEIDFTEDGSLEALERKLRKNRYHVLHFTGHGQFKNGKGYLQLENPLNLHAEETEAETFAQSLNCDPDHKIPLVLLSSCQTAQGGSEAGLRGVSNQLLKIGTPAVISMGMSIKDRYASEFAAAFYRRIAERQTIVSAFQNGLQHIRDLEYADQQQARVPNPMPLQWIIPNLYMSRPIEHLVNWQAPAEKLQLASHRYITEKKRLLLAHDKGYVFIGRRKEKAKILAPFFEKHPVLLKGQGGVGKTAMAEYLVQRLIAREPKTRPILFNEHIKSIEEINKQLKAELVELGEIAATIHVTQFEKAIEQFQYLVFELAKTAPPVFIFDNLESFQQNPGEAFGDAHQDIAEVIGFLCGTRKFHLILTCRYPLAGFENIRPFDLNQVGVNDFWKKCHHLSLARLQPLLLQKEQAVNREAPQQAPLRFIGIVRQLHQNFGGNYRALEFFDGLLREKPGQLQNLLQSLDTFQTRTAADREKVQTRMRENLNLPRLFGLLGREETALLQLSACFRIPVQRMAFQLQIAACDAEALNTAGGLAENMGRILSMLSDLTLIETSLDPETELACYYATPIVKDLLRAETTDALPFSHKAAGIYHRHIVENIETSVTEMEEAFFHFFEAKEKAQVEVFGDRLSDFYYGCSLFQNAHYYASAVVHLLGDKASAGVLNRLGLTFHLFGRYDDAARCYHASLEKYREIGDKSGEGTTLNNISQIFKARGDYETALQFLEQSLTI
ncbi:MAG: CHAT domain-containing protein, partial [Nitrospiria bacterium]